MLKKRKFQCVIMSAICAASVVSFTGCQKSPESSIVVNKDLDELIEQAENSEGDGLILEQKYDTYKTTLEDKSLKVKVNVDAKVDVPRADKMSLFRVSKQQITQELLDAVRKELLGDVKLYDGKVLKQTTKSDIEALIEVYRKQMENAEDQVIYQESQSAIEALEEEYNSAPADISFENIEAIDKFLSVSEKYNENPSDELYGWLYSLVPEGNVFFGVSDGSDDNYSMLYAVNSEDYGNYLSFRTGKHGYENMGVNGFRPANYAGTDMSGNKITPISDETAELSLEKAVGIADQFLETVGINNGTTEFRYCEGGLTKEKLYIDKKYDLEGIPERTYYVLTYTRYIDGAFITPGVADKYNENNEEGAFSKKSGLQKRLNFVLMTVGL